MDKELFNFDAILNRGFSVSKEVAIEIAHNKILLINLDPTITEIGKKLIEKGFSIYLYDPEIVEEEEISSNYFLSKKDIGKNRADAILQKLENQSSIVSIIKVDDYTQVKDDITFACIGFRDFDNLAFYDDYFTRKNIFCYCVNTSGIYGFFYNNIILDKLNKPKINPMNFFRNNENYFNRVKKLGKFEKADDYLFFAICLLVRYYKKNISNKDLPKEREYDKYRPNEQYQKKIFFIQTHLKLSGFLWPLEDQNFMNILESFLVNFNKYFSPLCTTLGEIVCNQIFDIVSKKNTPKCKMYVYNSEINDFDYISFFA